MTTLHFPESVPGNDEVLRLVAIRRKIHTFEVDKNFGIVVDKVIEGQFPAYYLDHIRRFFWREDCLRMVLHFSNTSIFPLALQDNLRMVLAYMDEVFNKFVKEMPQGIDLIPTARSKTFDAYLKIEFWVGRHEPPHVRQYRRANNRNIDRSDVTECDWEAYEARLGPLWSGSRTKYMLQESSWKVERADMLLMEMKKVYNPAFDKDPQFGYNFDEHEDGMDDGQTLDNGDDAGTKDESRPATNSEGKKLYEIDEDEDDDDGEYGTQTKKRKGARNSKRRGRGKR